MYIEVPSVGDEVKKHDQVGAVESVKAASDIYAPVSGTILKVNEKLESEPRWAIHLFHVRSWHPVNLIHSLFLLKLLFSSLINSSAFKDGWIAEIKLSNPDEVKELLGEAEYSKLIA